MRKAVKMVDEEEGVGESSSNLLLSVRKSAKELIRVALQSKENLSLLEHTDVGPSDVPSLVKEKKRLLQEKRSCEVELELRRRLLEEPLADVTFNLQDLQESVGELEREVVMERARHSQDEQLLQRLQGSVVLTEHLFQRPHPCAEEKALMNVVMEQCEVGGKVGRVNGEVVEGEREVGRLQKERAECQVRCREFVAQIEELRRVPEDEVTTPDTARLVAQLQLKSAECKLLRGSLQCVVVGSGVDWSESQPLTDLTLSLGHTPSWEPDS